MRAITYINTVYSRFCDTLYNHLTSMRKRAIDYCSGSETNLTGSLNLYTYLILDRVAKVIVIGTVLAGIAVIPEVLIIIIPVGLIFFLISKFNAILSLLSGLKRDIINIYTDVRTDKLNNDK